MSLTFHSTLRKLNTELPIGASHQVVVIWLNSYKEEDIQKSANQKQEWPVAAMFIDGSELNEQSLQMTFQGCFLPSVDSFGKAVSEKKNFQEINQSETRIACGGHVYQRIGTKLAIFIKVFPRMLPTKFRFIWPSGFRGEDFLGINQLETRIACGGHVC